MAPLALSGRLIDGEISAVELGELGLRLVESSEATPPPSASLTTDGGTWALLMWRGLPIAEAEARGALQIDGDRSLVERYLGAISRRSSSKTLTLSAQPSPSGRGLGRDPVAAI